MELVKLNKNVDNRPIGIFDSGLGGLTAVKSLSESLPNERFVYFGDTARTPYGSKSVGTIRNFSLQITDFLVENDVKMVLIACNTVSATCLKFLQNKYKEIPVLGIITPTVEFVAENMNEESKIGVIGTNVTIKSKQYERQLKSRVNELQVDSKACPLFVPLIEEGIHEKSIVDNVVKYYLDDFLLKNKISDLILGCTHYPILKGTIEELYPYLNIVNPSEVIAFKVKELLEKKIYLQSRIIG